MSKNIPNLPFQYAIFKIFFFSIKFSQVKKDTIKGIVFQFR